jgi:hypothetical protein
MASTDTFPEAPRFSARELPELRAKLIDYYGSGFPSPDVYPEESKRAIGSMLTSCDLVYVEEDMCELAVQAGKSLEVFSLHPSDVTFPNALIYFEKQIHALGNMLSVAVSENFFTVGLFVGAEQGPIVARVIAEQAPNAISGDVAKQWLDMPGLPPLVPFMGMPMHFGDRFDDVPAMGVDLARPLMAALLLMSQPLASETRAVAPRAAARRVTRLGVSVPDVRVISLRRTSGSSVGGGSREWSHRWMVRGHWRQQWYPSIGQNRPIWVDPYLKGPEGAPLLGGEKVYSWER